MGAVQQQEVEQHPLWMEVSLPQFPALAQDLKVDVAIVGAGLTGVTTAYLLSQQGLRVALLERNRIACADTGHTTSHLTYVTDERLHKLTHRLGKDAARMFWGAGASAISEIADIVRATQADCEFKWVTGYLHEPALLPDSRQHELLQQDTALAREFGFDAEFIEAAPYADGPAVRFPQQAKFHPRKYIKALLSAIQDAGGQIFEQSPFQDVADDSVTLEVNGRKVRCDHLVIATHNPRMGMKGPIAAALFQTKLTLYTSYVLGAELPANTLPEALFWDTNDPYEYLRVEVRDSHQYVIFGGGDVKTGQEQNTEAQFEKLEQRLRAVLPEARLRHRWMGQVVETDDGLPFIGENAPRQFIATGFSGNGFTLGTLSAMMIRDRLIQRANPWSDLLRVNRKPAHDGVWRYVRENLDYPYYLLRDRMARAERSTFEELQQSLQRGEGKVVALDGEKVAAYRDDQGQVTLCSPVCTHMKCLVHWNSADRTWDCPCHGSRFQPTGEVLSGPAEQPLEKKTPHAQS
jgi:glycine/D-amino acid oxidase-like deaminating enzyme/nitrite reductase/ring-hydroxylating ferredoxin subunit